MDLAFILLLVLGFLSLIAGIVGSIVPMMPGPQLSALGNLLIQAGLSLNNSSDVASWTLCLASIAFSIILAFVDFIAPEIVTRMGGASKTAGRYAMFAVVIVFIGSCVGGSVISTATAGFGTIPVIVVGTLAVLGAPCIGGMIGELRELPKDTPNRASKAIKAGFAHTVGIIGGMLAKAVYSITAVGIGYLQVTM